MKKILIPYLIVISLLISLPSCKKEVGMAHGQRPMPVNVQPVSEQNVPVYLEVIGNTVAHVTIQVRPQISGMLLEAHVKQGQEVKQGDLLYTIDPAPFQAALDKAEATLKKDQASLQYAKNKVTRYSELVKKKFVSELSYEQFETDVMISEAQLKIDEAEIDAAKINLNYTNIRAPIDGKVSLYLVDPGNLVTPTDSKPLTEIRQIAPIDVQFSLSQNDFQRLSESYRNDTYTFDVLLPNREIPVTGGQVYFIDNHVDLSTGTILLKGKVANEERLLWPGEFVRVRMFLKTAENALLVPASAIQYGQQGSYVYILNNDDTVTLRPIKLGQAHKEQFVVQEGLTEHDIVVTDGQINLRPGAKVIVMNKAEQATETNSKAS